MRRKRVDRTKGVVPAHLLPGSELCRFDPVEWRRQRDAWARPQWPELREAGINPLAWLLEAREATGQHVQRFPRERVPGSRRE